MGEKFKEVCGQGESCVCGMCEEGRENVCREGEGALVYKSVCVGKGEGEVGRGVSDCGETNGNQRTAPSCGM